MHSSNPLVFRGSDPSVQLNRRFIRCGPGCPMRPCHRIYRSRSVGFFEVEGGVCAIAVGVVAAVSSVEARAYWPDEDVNM